MKNQKEGSPYSSLDFNCISHDLIKRFCNSSWKKRWILSQPGEAALTRSKTLFVKLLITFFNNLDVTPLMVIWQLKSDSLLDNMWRDNKQFLTPSRRLQIFTLLQNNFRCTLQHFANKCNPLGLELVDVQCGGSVHSSCVVTAKATIDLALPNSVQWRIRVTIDTLCGAFYSLVFVVGN